jgi:GAF domain-containing protein
LALSDATLDSRYRPLHSSHEQHCRAYICAPLRIQNEIVGAMTARRNHWHEWTSEEILFFETVCKQVAIVLERQYVRREARCRTLAAWRSRCRGVVLIKNLCQHQNSEYHKQK